MMRLSNFMLGLNVDFLIPIINAINAIWIPLIALLGTGGTIYSIILAVNLAKADTADKRQAAKKRIIAVLTTIICLIALVIFLRFFLEKVPGWVADK